MALYKCCIIIIIIKIPLVVLAQLTNATDGQTDGQTDGHRMPAIAALCIASHGKSSKTALEALDSPFAAFCEFGLYKWHYYYYYYY